MDGRHSIRTSRKCRSHCAVDHSSSSSENQTDGKSQIPCSAACIEARSIGIAGIVPDVFHFGFVRLLPTNHSE